MSICKVKDCEYDAIDEWDEGHCVCWVHRFELMRNGKVDWKDKK